MPPLLYHMTVLTKPWVKPPHIRHFSKQNSSTGRQENAMKEKKLSLIKPHIENLIKVLGINTGNRPYALTSRLHNNDAMLGVKTCRAARTCCAGRALALSASQSVRGPGPARRYGMQGLARWLHAWRWRT